MSILTTGKGKKGQIEMLLKEGKSDDEIVEQLGTTKSYVQKVKSQRKSTLNSKNSVSDIEEDESVDVKRVLETNKETTILPEHKPSSTSEEKELTKNERRKIYNLFFKGWKPSKIVAKMGYSYEVVEAEYRNYNKDIGLDMQTFQKQFMSKHGADNEDIGSEGKALVKRYKRDGYLLNEDFSELLQLIWDNDKEDAIKDVLEGEVSPPEGLTRIPCDVCGKPMKGAIVNPSNNMGTAILQFCRDDEWGHGPCVDKYEANEDKEG